MSERPATIPLSGRQVRLAGHGYEATIASVGASLRTLTYGGRDLIRPFAADELRPSSSGVTLAPWPNRVAGARYTWDGVAYQLDVSEPARGNASHGLLSWAGFDVVEAGPSAAELVAVIEPRKGYPHRVQVRVRFSLCLAGLSTSVTATLLSEAPAPYGTGSHPYLVAPGGRADEWVLSLPAATIQDVNRASMRPTGLRSVQGSPEDFRWAHAVGSLQLDNAYTDLVRDAGGRFVASVTNADGVGTRISWDESCPWVQVFTADSPGSAADRNAIAVEPMTCPPGAFNSGTDLLRLLPGEPVEASWLIGSVEG